MTTATCPYCGHPVEVKLAKPDGTAPRFNDPGAAGAQYSDARTRAKERRRLPGDPDPVNGRPFPVFRGEGAERERQWGAVLDAPVEAGARVQLVTKSGNAWTSTVAEPMGQRSGGYLVTVAGAEWKPDPDVPIPDPDWLHDETDDVTFRGGD